MSQTSSNKLNHANLQRTNGTNSWAPPASFSVTSERDGGIFLVDKTHKRNKQPPQPFSLTPLNDEESLALSGWDESDDIKFNIREENSVNRNSDFSHSTANTVTYDDDNDDTASVATCSTATTTTTSSDYPSVLYVTIADLIKMQERRNSMQKNINNYNMTVDTTTPVSNKSKQKIVNFKDEIVESPVEGPLKNSIPPRSNNSNDSSTIRDNNSSHQDEISIAPSLGLPKISPEEFEMAKFDKQKKLRGWVKCLWPQPRLPATRYLAAKLNANSLSRRNLNPLIIGVITTVKSGPMISTIIVKGTSHENNGIGRNGQIRFTGDPILGKELYDPREYLLFHCPTFRNPPYNNGDPRIPWNEKFLLNKVLPKLAAEATEIQNEVSLYLTVKETLLRGFGHKSLYACRICQPTNTKTFTYDEVKEHLSNKHGVKAIIDEEMIRINLRAYAMTFYKSLPPKIVPG